MIRGLTDSTKTTIDINDDGVVSISGSAAACEEAREKIESLTRDIEIGKIYEGRVENIIENVGAVVSIMPGRDGLLHISQISESRTDKVSDALSLNQTVRVKVLRSDGGKVRFTMRDMDQPAPPAE